MLSRLEAAFARERAFVSDASHELRTPLAILRTELELALRGEHTREELEDALRSAAEETERLSRLAEDLLVIARSDQGRLPVRIEDLAAGDLLARVAGRFQTRARVEGRPLRPDPSPGVIVRADPARLEQALANLVDNALSYGDGTVELTASRSNGTVEIHVRDEGPGFPPAFLPRAFERFTRADEARSRENAASSRESISLRVRPRRPISSLASGTGRRSAVSSALIAAARLRIRSTGRSAAAAIV